MFQDTLTKLHQAEDAELQLNIKPGSITQSFSPACLHPSNPSFFSFFTGKEMFPDVLVLQTKFWHY